MEYKLLQAKDNTKRLDFQDYNSVIIPAINNKYTICVSCQSGCCVGCKFCHTAKIKFKRNLTTEEIFNQIIECQKLIKTKPQAIVFMGMGEPSFNIRAVLDAVEKIHNELAIAYRRITISTAGFQNINQLLKTKANIAISLHSPFDKIRKKLIPGTISIKKILDFAKEYCKRSKKQYLMLEYFLIKGINDSDKDLQKLLKLKFPKNTLFNLLEFNSIDKFQASTQQRLIEFKKAIIKNGYKCFIRQARGRDISAACGMLSLN